MVSNIFSLNKKIKDKEEQHKDKRMINIVFSDSKGYPLYVMKVDYPPEKHQELANHCSTLIGDYMKEWMDK